MGEEQRIREMEFLKYEIQEIEEANLQSGEDETLEAQYQKCLMREKFFLIVQQYMK